MKSDVRNDARLVHIDLLKCLAIYFVLFFHGTLYINVVTPGMSAMEVLRYLSRSILSTCVPLFFFINGYLLLSRPMDLKKHLGKILRLGGITCFWMLFLLLALQSHFGEYYTWESFWASCWELRDGWNNHLWYMGALISLYLIFPILKSAFDRERKSFYWVAAVMAFVVFGCSTVDLGVTAFRLLARNEYNMLYNNLPVFYLFNPFTYQSGLALTYFCLGGVTWVLEPRLREIPARWRNAAAAVGLVTCCGMLGILGWRISLYGGITWNHVWFGYNTVFTLGNVLCLYLLSLSWNRDCLPVRVISTNTLGIYLLHDLIHKHLCPWVTQYPEMRSFSGTVVYAAALLLITLGICLVLKKIPLVKHLI